MLCNSRLIFAYYIFKDFPKEIYAKTLIDYLIKIMNIVYLYLYVKLDITALYEPKYTLISLVDWL